MELAKTYDPTKVEDKWNKHWIDQGFFKSTPDEREPFTIVIPPPNVTGVLHMGHILNNTIQDILTRRARMQGKNACWVPGTDHASIATESKVVNKLKEEGINKSDLTREEFIKHAWEWTDKHDGIILEQLKKLGASCDWDRTRFTMEDDLSDAVLEVFVDLYNKGLIYKGSRMVNWDPKALTAISDEEVIHKEVQSKLYYLKYQIEGTNDEWLTIATTRPETILGDTAICINPNDDRFKHLHDKKALVPLINRSIPIILDDYVDMEFGTGCLKVTPAHDANDYELGKKHNLESIDIFNDNGTLNESAQLYIGQDRFEVRDIIVKDLNKNNHVEKIEDYVNKVGYSERTDAIIEPKMSDQWFMNMAELGKPALENVMNDNIQFHPKKFKNTYKHWMENIRDWCISRQLWWGHRIPAWYCKGEECKELVMVQIEKPEKCTNCDGSDKIYQDEDVLDTWFSSWLWPISVFDGFKNPDNEDIKYYYPTNDLVTAPEILFFWVARMIMAGYEYRKELPFKNVYLTGIVRDQQRRKMSKSLGNSPEPLDLIDKYGADGIRTGMLFCSPAGNDLLFDESLCEQGRNFSNKIWNAFRLIKSWEVKDGGNSDNEAALTWFDAKLNETIETIEDHYSKFRMSDALMSVYRLLWDDFCSWYLEMIKPPYQQPIDRNTYDRTIAYFETLMKLLHPLMPFITEEIWHLINERKDSDCITVSTYPKIEKYDQKVITDCDDILKIVTGIRGIRKENNISNKETICTSINTSTPELYKSFETIIKKLANIDKLTMVDTKVDGALSFAVGSDEIFVELEGNIDVEAEVSKLTKELEHAKGFLKSVDAKLSNKGFVNNAGAEVVDREKQKKADAESKIKVLENNLANLMAMEK